MQAQMWLSLFRVRSNGGPDRPAGFYGAAFVDYQEGSVLTYHELLVARLVRAGRTRRVRITDIWVDSPVSREGGRSLWAIPKELAEMRVVDRRSGAVARTTCSGSADGTSIASAAFTAVPGVVRTPFTSMTSQPREDGSVVVTKLSGSGKSLPCLGSWDFDRDGALGWLHGRKPIMSVRMTDLRLRFG
jgi:Acetoacetate decarboxylase (ADC)